MGDAQRKTEIEKVEKEESASVVGFAELRDDLFREAAKLVSEVPSTKIAIFVTPPSSESDVSIQSFGYPSVEGVVQTFLEDNCPVEEEDEQGEDDDKDPSPKRFWWEDEQFDSMNPEQLDDACDRLARARDQLTLVLEAKLRAQRSGNQEDLHNHKAGPKP